MNREQKKQYLNGYLDLKREIDSLTEEYHFWEETSYTIPVTNLNNLGIHGNSQREPLMKHLDICIEIQDKINQANEKMKEILSVIESLEGNGQTVKDQRSVLRFRYINGYYFHEITKKMQRSYDSIFKLHRKGLDDLKI